MKTNQPCLYSILRRIGAAALVLPAAITLNQATAQENAVLLEGFEANLDYIEVMGGRAMIETYTRFFSDDPYVTEGTNSLKVTIVGQEWWNQDLRINLSDEAAAKVREAAATGDEARYIIRWDYVFPESGTTSWMNSQAFLTGVGWFNDQLDSNNGKQTMSIAVDTIADLLPTEGPISITLAQNFDATEDPFNQLAVYIDNIRLVDTYAPGASPVTHVLQDFEADTDLETVANFTGWGGGQRTTYSRHAATGPEDPRVSHGTSSLRVDYAGTGTWGSDFTLSFAGTKLEEILMLSEPVESRPTKDELRRYTLRFEVVYPERGDDWSGDWMNTSFNTQAAGFPWSQGGSLAPFETIGFKKTYSIALDLINWADWTDPKPSLMFIANGAWGANGTAIFYDNFRLIDTGSTGAAQPKIESITVNAQGKVVITWTGGGTLQSATSLVSPQWNAVPGAASGSPIDPPAGGMAFYRIAQ